MSFQSITLQKPVEETENRNEAARGEQQRQLASSSSSITQNEWSTLSKPQKSSLGTQLNQSDGPSSAYAAQGAARVLENSSSFNLRDSLKFATSMTKDRLRFISPLAVNAWDLHSIALATNQNSSQRNEGQKKQKDEESLVAKKKTRRQVRSSLV